GQTTALTVPAQAVVVRDGHSYVFVIGPDDKAEARRITTGRRAGDRVEAVDGLEPGDRVAVQGAGFLNEGDLVKVAD
ncbi:MAG: efflux transporter periplasmic adaptor subunit, partial [Hydrogenophaga sp.]|nr:efflux transporter periplasmic adaptor subunit [Hydrogenophaga sp.]